jgi:uncharacterized protein YndB with AHSA1/START domain
MTECRYAIYLHAGAEAVWRALTDPELTAAYWAHRNESDWSAGSPWRHVRGDGSDVVDIEGTVLESAPPTRLVLTWANPGDGTAVAGADADADPALARAGTGGPSVARFDIEPHGEIVRLTVTHGNLGGEAERDALASGWAAVLSNLKSLLETGRPLPRPPWEMLPGFVRR